MPMCLTCKYKQSLFFSFHFYDSKCFLFLGRKSWSVPQRWHTSDCTSLLSLMYCLQENFSISILTIIFCVFILSQRQFFKTNPNSFPSQNLEAERGNADYQKWVPSPIISQKDCRPAYVCLLPLLRTILKHGNVFLLLNKNLLHCGFYPYVLVLTSGSI